MGIDGSHDSGDNPGVTARAVPGRGLGFLKFYSDYTVWRATGECPDLWDDKIDRNNTASVRGAKNPVLCRTNQRISIDCG